jgi:hypothetical protein
MDGLGLKDLKGYCSMQLIIFRKNKIYQDMHFKKPGNMGF